MKNFFHFFFLSTSLMVDFVNFSLSLSHSPSLYLSLALSFSLYLSPMVNWWLDEWMVYNLQSDSSQTFFLFLANSLCSLLVSFSNGQFARIGCFQSVYRMDRYFLSLSLHTLSHSLSPLTFQWLMVNWLNG